jgi:hypothetical protein
MYTICIAIVVYFYYAMYGSHYNVQMTDVGCLMLFRFQMVDTWQNNDGA